MAGANATAATAIDATTTPIAQRENENAVRGGAASRRRCADIV